MSEFIDYPMPDEYPDYPSHELVLKYFESYCDYFDLRKYIQFNKKVTLAHKLDNNKWSIELEDGEVSVFDYLLVANGHHSVPNHPSLKDDFKGKYVHSHSYKYNDAFQGERVLVIGAGNSACDCAVEISRVASRVDLSVRTPQYIVPKFFLGQPADTFNKGLLWLPRPVKNLLLQLSLKFQVGSYSNYGLPEPKHGVLEAHPTMNSELLYKIRHGKVNPKPGIDKIEGRTVWFKDNSSEDYDTVVAATGYKIETAFFKNDFLNYSDSDRIELYLRMIHPEHHSLFFIGLFQPQGAIWPGSDWQSKLIAQCILGNWKMPHNVKQLASDEADAIEKNYLKRKRHTIEVDYHEFVKSIQKELARVKS